MCYSPRNPSPTSRKRHNLFEIGLVVPESPTTQDSPVEE
jgi:hypothetical protein